MDDIDAMIEVGTRLLGISVRDEWRAAVRAHLMTTMRLGALVLAADIADTEEPAPVFTP